MLKKWLSFGLSGDQEDRYRKSCFPADLAQARICLLLMVIPLVAFLVNDYAFLGLSRLFYGLVALRLALVVYTVVLANSTRRMTSYLAYDRAEFAWAFFLSLVAVSTAATRPENFFVHAVAVIVLVFIILLVVPNKFVNQIIVSLALTLGEVGVITLISHPSSFQAAFAIVSSLLLAGTLGVATSWHLHLSRRKAFLAAEKEQVAVEALGQLNVELEQRVATHTAEIRHANETLEQRIAQRTSDLQAATDSLRDSRRAALNLMDDALDAGRQAEQAAAELRQEVTSRKRAEEALAKEQANLQAVFDVVNVGMLLLDGDGVVKRVNNTISRWVEKTCYTYNGDQPGDFVGCVHAVDNSAGCGHSPHCRSCSIRNAFESVLNTGQSVHDVEVESVLLIDRKKVHLWLDVSADPVLVNGKRHVILAMNNVTARKRAEEQVASLASFPRLNPNPIVEIDPEGHIHFMNPAAEVLFPDLKERQMSHPWFADLETILGDVVRGGTRPLVRDVAIGDRWYQQMLHYVEHIRRIRIYSLDITERRRAEREREITIQFLQLVNDSTDSSQLIQAAATFFQEQSGCEAVGVRVKEDDDYPYYVARGFPTEFVRLENSLCSRNDAGAIVRDSAGNPTIECMCGNIICGRIDPSKPFFTRHGSFWTNGTTELLASTTEADRQARTRNRCNGEGYESVALLPLHVGSQRLGLLQLNDRRKGVFTSELIGLWERLADHFAVALSKFRADERLAKANQDLNKLNRTLKALRNSSQAMVCAVDESDYLQEVCRIVVEDCGHAMVWVGYAEEDEERTVRPVADFGFETGYLESLKISWADTERGRGPTGMAIRTGKSCSCRNMLTDPDFAPWREEAVRRGYASSIVLPLTANKKTFGAINIYSSSPDSFLDEEAALLGQLADDVAYGITAIRLRAAHAQSEEALRESEERHQLATSVANEAIWEVNLATGTSRWNRAYAELFGPPSETTAHGPWWLDHIHPEDREQVDSSFRDALAEGADSWFCDYRMKLADGSYAFLHDRALIVRDSAGRPVRAVGAKLNITKQKQAEESLRRQAALIDLSPDASIVRQLDGTITFWSHGAESLYGWTKEEVLGRRTDDFFQTQYAMPVRHVAAQLKRTGHWTGDVRHRTKDGREVIVQSWWLAQLDAEGEIAEILETNVDITDRKQWEASLENSVHRFGLLAQSAETFLETDQPQQVVEELCRKVMEHLDCQMFFNFLVDEGADRLHLNACAGIPPEETQRIEWLDYGAAVCGCVAREGQRVVAEHIPCTPDPRTDLVKSYGAKAYACHPILGMGGKVLGTLSFGTCNRETFSEADLSLMKAITDQVAVAMIRLQSREDLRNTADNLGRSNKDLEQFAYVASHDLQEPLRMVSGFVQLLQKKYGGQLDAEADRFIEYAVDGAKQMQTLINDLLAYSRVGSRGCELVPTDVGATLRQVLDHLRPLCREVAAEVTYGHLPTARADGTQLVQLLQNLIGNALKFRGEGPPKIHVDACLKEDHWLFSVRDNGIGIDPEYRDRIFLIFQRLHTRQKYPGTGMGLAICKKIVERHGGQIWVESQPGEGSVFYFTIPI